MTPVRRLADVAELVAASGNDAYVRASADPARTASAWAHADGALGWLIPSRRLPDVLHLTATGPPRSAAALTHELRQDLGSSLGSVTLPRDADRQLPPSYVLRPRNNWEWFVTWEPPPAQPREGEVGWLDASNEELSRFLARWSPRHDAKPGRPGVLRWSGVRGADNRLIAVGAHAEHVAGVPHLASIATSGALRGRGYGAAVTAWITRTLLDEGCGWVTLGMYSDNEVARRMYHRLGYRCDHYLTSGGLIVTG